MLLDPPFMALPGPGRIFIGTAKPTANRRGTMTGGAGFHAATTWLAANENL